MDTAKIGGEEIGLQKGEVTIVGVQLVLMAEAWRGIALIMVEVLALTASLRSREGVQIMEELKVLLMTDIAAAVPHLQGWITKVLQVMEEPNNLLMRDIAAAAANQQGEKDHKMKF